MLYYMLKRWFFLVRDVIYYELTNAATFICIVPSYSLISLHDKLFFGKALI